MNEILETERVLNKLHRFGDNLKLEKINCNLELLITTCS